MAEISRNPLGYKTKKITLLVSSILGITLIGALIWGGMTIMNYRGGGGLPPMASAPAQVAITSPQLGARAQVGDTVTVDVSAIGPTAYNSIELWLNGELAGVQSAPSGGMQPFSAQFLWNISEPGIYPLMAIGVDANEVKSLSPQVVVLVPDDEEINIADLSTRPVIEPSAPGGGSVPPDPPSEGETVNPAGIWVGTLGDIATGLTADERPNPPELAARPRDCAASLFIHDLSDDEEGFIVYRQMINTPNWQKIATLSSQSQVEWLEYVDAGVSGAVTYYVSAFNSQGEAQSNPVLVIIDPAKCLNDEEPAIVESVDVALELTEIKADKVYCYLSRDGENWSRWPTIGFFSPDDQGNLPEIPIMVQRKSDPGSEQGPNPLMMECWGWQGGGLAKLGELFTESLQPDLTGKMQVFGNGINARISVKTEAVGSTGDLYPVGLTGLVPPLLEFDPGLALQPPLTPVDPDLPKVNLSMTFDREICGQHIPPEAQNALGKAMFCFPYPEYDLDKGANFPQPYLVWGFDLEPTCAGGMGENCKSYWELLSMADATGGQVGFTITGMMGGVKQVWNVTEPNLTMFVVPPLACIGDTEYTVRLWYRPGKQGVAEAAAPGQQISEIGGFEISPAEVLYGPTSHPAIIPCKGQLLTPSLVDYYRKIRVEFNDLKFTGLDDGGDGEIGLFEDYSVELYGYFRVKAPSMGHWATEYCFTGQLGNCNDPPYWTGTFRYLLVAEWEEDDFDNLLLIVPAGNDSYNSADRAIGNWKLCKSTTKYSCDYDGQATSFETTNTELEIYVKEGDKIKIQMRLVDYDELSDDDDLCVGTFEILADDILSRDLFSEKSFVVEGENTDSGRCTLYGLIYPISDWKTSIP